MALNFADLFEHAADVFGDRIALVCGDRQVTYRELDERTNRLAHHLAGIGVGAGDHVGLYARNSIEAAETISRRASSAPSRSTSTTGTPRTSCGTCSPTPTWSRWSTTGSSRRGSPR